MIFDIDSMAISKKEVEQLQKAFTLGPNKNFWLPT